MVKRYEASTEWGEAVMSEHECGDWVSYEDYETLRQQLEAVKPERGDGWIEWGGGECPLEPGIWVEVKLSSGVTITANHPEDWEWRWYDTQSNIVAYRLVS